LSDVLNDLGRIDVPDTHEIRTAGETGRVAGTITWEQLRKPVGGLAALRRS
jgi:hypothetical protein